MSARECVGVHHLVEELRSTAEYAERFAPVVREAPPESSNALCLHVAPMALARAAQYDRVFFNHINRMPSRMTSLVWSLDKTVQADALNGQSFEGFVACWSYYCRIFIGTGVIHGGDPLVFKLSECIETKALVDLLAEKADLDKKYLDVVHFSAKWGFCESSFQAELTNRKVSRVKPAKATKPTKAQTTAASSSTELPLMPELQVDGDDEEEVDELDLEAELALLIGSDFAFGGDDAPDEDEVRDEDYDLDGGPAEDAANEHVGNIAALGQQPVGGDSLKHGQLDVNGSLECAASVLESMDDASRQIVFDILKAKAHANRAEVVTMLQRCEDQRSHVPLAEKEISLVVTEGSEVIFVTWTLANARRGRRISLDGRNRIISIVAYAVKEQFFTNCEVIVPCTGGSVVRVPASERPYMPDWCLLAQHYHQIQMFSGPLLSSDLPKDQSTCAFCTALETQGRKQDLSSSDMYVCVMCLSPWHVQCAKALALKDQERFVCFQCLA